MTPTDAANVTAMIVETWQGGPAEHVWVNALTKLELIPAIETYEHLRETDERPPSIARFFAAHKARTTPRHEALHAPCVTCAGLGWESVTTQHTGHPHPTSGVKPCRCTNGQAVSAGYHRALDDNDRALGRTQNQAKVTL